MENINSLYVGFVNTYSTVMYTNNKKKQQRKRAYTICGKNIHVPINKKNNLGLIYVTLQITKIGIYIDGCIQNVIGLVGNIEAERLYLSKAVTIDWCNNKKINCQERLNDLSNRKDFRECNIFSIDPEGCYDIDDAMHIEYKDTGKVIYIHIADVSHYISNGSNLDIELSKRVSSCYLKHEQIDMLPREFVNKCSLILNEDRYAITFIIELNNFNEIISTNFCKSIINNKKNYSYDEANRELVNNKDMKTMYEIGKIFNKGDDYDIHKMIEVFMVITNSHAAKLIYKCHPNTVPIRYCSNKPVNITEPIQKKIKLFNMSSAKYEIGYNGKRHETLNEDIYTHFTSPIRRYFDIIVHRYITDIIEEKLDIEYSINTDIINNKNNYYKKLERQSHALNIATRLYEENKCYNKIHIANVIGAIDNILYIYIPNLELDYTCKVYSKKLKYITQSFENNIIRYNNVQTNHIMEIKVGDRVKINIIVTMLSPKSKIIVKLLNNTLVMSSSK